MQQNFPRHGEEGASKETIPEPQTPVTPRSFGPGHKKFLNIHVKMMAFWKHWQRF